MALVYEHWRPDTNECFYVGASRDGEDTRPYDYSSHNDDYDAIIACLEKNDMKPFTKIIWVNLERDCVGTYEKMRIAYQRALLGDSLTNIADGGDGFNFDWDDELRARQRQVMIEYYKTPDGEKCIKKMKETKKEFYNSQKGKETKDNHSKWWKNFLLTPEGKKYCQENTLRWEKFLASPEGENWCIENSKRVAEFHASPKGRELRKKQSESKIEFFASPEGQELRKKLSDMRLTLIQDPEHVKKHREKCIAANQDIGNRPEVRAKRKSNALDLWKNIEYRMNMALRDWHRTYVKKQFYWGA